VRPGHGIAGFDKLTLEFVLDDRDWRLTSESLTKVTNWTDAPAGQLIDSRISTKDVSDCGEGG
jgi:hypothetical protein